MYENDCRILDIQSIRQSLKGIMTMLKALAFVQEIRELVERDTSIRNSTRSLLKHAYVRMYAFTQ